MCSQRSRSFRVFFFDDKTLVSAALLFSVDQQVADLFKLGSPALVGFERIADNAGESHHATRTGERIEHNMPRRTTTAELRDRLDGLALAFFAVSGSLIDAMIEAHPDQTEMGEDMRNGALMLIASLGEVEQDAFSQEAISQAWAAVVAAFAAWVEEPADEPSNNNG